MLQIAKILLYNQHSQILLLRRSASHPRHAHHPDLPGGEVEPSETPEDTAARELLEETGIDIPASTIKLIAKKQASPDKRYLLLEAKLAATPKVTISWEHESFDWLTKQQILELDLPDGLDGFFRFAYDELSRD